MVISQRWVKEKQPVFIGDHQLDLICAVLQLEDLIKVEGMTEKRFSSFMKVSKSFSSSSLQQGCLFYAV